MHKHGRLSHLLRLGSVAAAAAALLAGSGCTTATAPDARCLSSRPAWSYRDNQRTRAKQNAAARIWDRQCTLVGVIDAAAAGQ